MLAPPHSDGGLWAWSEGRFRWSSWSALEDDAASVASALRALGCEPGESIGFVLSNRRETIRAVLGAWMLGATVVSLPTKPRRMGVDEYGRGLERLVASSGVRFLLADEDAHAVQPGPVLRYDALTGTGRNVAPHSWRDEEVLFVQHSSGSTARPKGCELTSGAVRAQLAMLRERLAFSQDDTMVSWLPLSHDMGFFGALLLCLDTGAQLVLGTPGRFILSPGTWLDDCATFGATITLGPNFAVDVITRAGAPRRPADLGALRAWIVGAEHTRADTLARAASLLSAAGATATELTPAYGLAEATLGVTMHAPGESPRVRVVDIRALGVGRLEPASANSADGWAVVSAGHALGGAAVRIREQNEIAHGLGEVVVRSQSLARGYRGDPQATADAFGPGGLKTGDQGFVDDGLLYLTGRLDSLLVVAGRSVPAESVESRLADALRPDIRACALVQAPETGRIAFVIERRPGGRTERKIAAAARIAIAQLDLVADSYTFVEPGHMPRTPSGKLRRSRCRALAFDHDDPPIERTDASRSAAA